jgi:hypothetical protein
MGGMLSVNPTLSQLGNIFRFFAQQAMNRALSRRKSGKNGQGYDTSCEVGAITYSYKG